MIGQHSEDSEHLAPAGSGKHSHSYVRPQPTPDTRATRNRGRLPNTPHCPSTASREGRGGVGGLGLGGKAQSSIIAEKTTQTRDPVWCYKMLRGL